MNRGIALTKDIFIFIGMGLLLISNLRKFLKNLTNFFLVQVVVYQ